MPQLGGRRFGFGDEDSYGDTDLPRRRFQTPIYQEEEEQVPQELAAPSIAPPDYGSFEMPTYQGYSSPIYSFGDVPDFNAPRFDAPSFEDAQNSPGYQFRLGQGEDALQKSAAARGILRTGGTLKDILEYGQNFASQEYQNVYDRALRGYGANYQAAKDEFAPQFAQYQNQFQAEQARAMAEFNRQMELYNAQNQAAMYREGLANNALQTPMPQFPGYGG